MGSLWGCGGEETERRGEGAARSGCSPRWKGPWSESTHRCFLQTLGCIEGDIVCIWLVTGEHFEVLYQAPAGHREVILIIMPPVSA